MFLQIQKRIMIIIFIETIVVVRVVKRRSLNLHIQLLLFILESLNLVRIDHSDQLKCWAKYYKNLSSDSTGQSLNQDYQAYVFCNNPHNPHTWNINDPISLSDIRNTVHSMKCNKASESDGVPIEFYKAFFCNHDLSCGLGESLQGRVQWIPHYLF